MVHEALYAAKIIAYAQGMDLISKASQLYGWDLNLSQIVSLWRGGCIIRAKFLKELSQAYLQRSSQPLSDQSSNLIAIPEMQAALQRSISSLRECVSSGVLSGITLPAFSASLAYFDSYITADLPQNLTQAQRDFFGAHTYRRRDRDGIFHTKWEE
jgi:6-phosphogluconate dehydrogenase